MFSTDDFDAKHLKELPNLISPNRQFLMEQSTHCKLIKSLVDLFKIPSTQYQILIKNSNQVAQKHVNEAGYGSVLERNVKIKLDAFYIYILERDAYMRIDDYAGLVLSRSAGGITRNSLELSVAFLTVGTSIQILESSR